MPKPKIHVSHLITGARCGEQLRRILAGERIPPGIAAFVGTLNHKADEMDMTAKLLKKPIPDLSASNDFVAQAGNSLWREGIFLNDEDREVNEKVLRGKAIDRAIRLNTLRHTQLVPTITPTAVARKWVLEIEGMDYDLAGEIDLEDEEGSILDLKTKGKAPPKDEADKSIQLTMYTIGKYYTDRIMPPKVKLNVLVCSDAEKAVAKLVTLESTRSPEEIESMMARIANFIDCLKKGVFMPCNPDQWCCSSRWCGFYLTCPYVRGRKVFAT
jgi:hypothetical protein